MASASTDDALANLLASGDVDAVRRSLQAQLGIATAAARPAIMWWRVNEN